MQSFAARACHLFTGTTHEATQPPIVREFSALVQFGGSVEYAPK
jgi:hypothetical protein